MKFSTNRDELWGAFRYLPKPNNSDWIHVEGDPDGEVSFSFGDETASIFCEFIEAGSARFPGWVVRRMKQVLPKFPPGAVEVTIDEAAFSIGAFRFLNTPDPPVQEFALFEPLRRGTKIIQTPDAIQLLQTLGKVLKEVSPRLELLGITPDDLLDLTCELNDFESPMKLKELIRQFSHNHPWPERE